MVLKKVRLPLLSLFIKELKKKNNAIGETRAINSDLNSLRINL